MSRTGVPENPGARTVHDHLRTILVVPRRWPVEACSKILLLAIEMQFDVDLRAIPTQYLEDVDGRALQVTEQVLEVWAE